jgi:hypothetical protein
MSYECRIECRCGFVAEQHYDLRTGTRFALGELQHLDNFVNSIGGPYDHVI